MDDDHEAAAQLETQIIDLATELMDDHGYSKDDCVKILEGALR